MNFITVPYNSKFFYARPDTSLNRDSNDYFCREDITKLAVSFFIYAKASKAAKAVSGKYANRYYNLIGVGIHLSAPQMRTEDPNSFWLSQSLDSSTFLIEELDKSQIAKLLPLLEGTFLKDFKEDQLLSLIDKAFEQSSQYISIRTGDFICIESSFAEIDANTNILKVQGKEINIYW